MGDDSWDVEDELQMTSSTIIVAVSVVAGVAVLLAIAVGAGLYLSRRRNRVAKQSFDPSKMERAAASRPMMSSSAKHMSDSSFQQPLLHPIAFPDSPPHASKEFDRSSWRSDNTYTNEWHEIPGSEETNGKQTDEPSLAPSPPRNLPSLPRIDTSAPPKPSVAVLDVIQSSISPAPSIKTAADTASLYSLPSAKYSIHDLQQSPSIPPIPALPYSLQPKYSLEDEPSPLTRGNTRTVAQMLKTRARRSAAQPKTSRSDSIISRIERMGSIRSPAVHVSETDKFVLPEDEEDGMKTPRQL